MAEWSNAALLKSVDCNRSGGSNPSLSANLKTNKMKTINTILLMVSLFCLGVSLYQEDYTESIGWGVVTVLTIKDMFKHGND